MLRAIIVTCTFFIISHSFAQVEWEEHGCHFVKKGYSPKELTEAEKEYVRNLDLRSDTFDIINFEIDLDITNFSGKKIKAATKVDFTFLQDDLDYINLDLMNLQIDSVKSGDVTLTFTYDFLLLSIDLLQTFNIGEETSVTVYYQGTPTLDVSGFGGLDFNGGYAYALGIGLDANPHNYGRSWYPCFDNFRERATYDINIKHKNNHEAHAVGTYLGSDDVGDGSSISSFRMDQPLPTYLTSIAVADYATVHLNHTGIAGDIPIELIARPQDTSKMKASFEYLPHAIDALESWWGPYQWEKVGYVATIVGAMEHPTLTAYPEFTLTSGSPTGNMALMGHELAHHWWGNVTTLTTEGDMWIKEGNAEYGEYLFYEHFFGRDYFMDVVRDNHKFVLASAHINDDGYRALSGMPNMYTYGTHTYYKGATVMHTLRGYLGDELYKEGLYSILQNYPFSHIDAAGFRDQVSAQTGIDMGPFFDAWIYNPGFAAFEIDSVLSVQAGDDYTSKVFVEQKLLAAPEMHLEVPIWINAYGALGEVYKEKLMVSDQFSIVDLSTEFLPVRMYLNEEDHLNQARTAESLKIYQTGPHTFEHTDLWVDVIEVGQDTVDMRIEHYWVAPDDFKNNPNDIKLSSTHYWSITGNPTSDFHGKINFGYSGSNMYAFDTDLTGITEDSIMLLYRKDAASDWFQYAYAEKKTIFPGDGTGYFKCDSLLMGQYTFGNGEFSTSTKEDNLKALANIIISPNPASDWVNVEVSFVEGSHLITEIYTIDGRLVTIATMDNQSDQFRTELNVSDWPSGQYMVKIKASNQVIGAANFIKSK